MSKILAAAVLSALLAPSAGAEVSFDRGVDVKAAVTDAQKIEIVLPDADKYDGQRRYTRDCVRFSAGPGDNDISSEKVWLRSTEYIEECHTVMQPGPNGTQVPVQHCYERPGMTWNQTAQLRIKARKLFPWESESFDVCLEGPWMHLYANRQAYKYSVDREGQYNVLYTLTPKEKIATGPDEEGLSLAEFSYDAAAKKYVLKLGDKWAAEYAGEKTVVKVELYKDGFWFFDGFKGEKEFTFDAAAGYEVGFAESELDTSKAASDADRGAKKYYVKWGFKRVGAVSTDDFVKKGETPRIEI